MRSASSARAGGSRRRSIFGRDPPRLQEVIGSWGDLRLRPGEVRRRGPAGSTSPGRRRRLFGGRELRGDRDHGGGPLLWAVDRRNTTKRSTRRDRAREGARGRDGVCINNASASGRAGGGRRRVSRNGAVQPDLGGVHRERGVGDRRHRQIAVIGRSAGWCVRGVLRVRLRRS
jgi:hypothetical protein